MSTTNNLIVTAGRRVLLAGVLAISLCGCSGASDTTKSASSTSQEVSATATASESEATADSTNSVDSSSADSSTTANVTATGALDATSLFTERDLTQVADTSGATTLTVTSGEDLQITEEGVYVISGEATEASLVVDVDDAAKVQLVLDGVSITNNSKPAIYVKNADKVFVTTVAGSTNTLQVTGTFEEDGETSTDAVIFSKDDLVLNGQGALNINSTDNAITSKDDLKVTGGTYVITCTGDALEANNGIAIADGTFTITTSNDALTAEYDEDDTVGFIYICGGTFAIDAADDALHATTVLQLDGGTFEIAAAEALEATYVQVNDGSVTITASDDAINATYKSQSMGTPTIEITGGQIAITMGAGDTDALDSNGDIIVSGGSVDITGQFAFDFDGTASFTGGSITVNGEQISEITNSMMMGGGMGAGPMGEMGEAPMEGGPMGEMGGTGAGPRTMG